MNAWLTVCAPARAGVAASSAVMTTTALDITANRSDDFEMREMPRTLRIRVMVGRKGLRQACLERLARHVAYIIFLPAARESLRVALLTGDTPAASSVPSRDDWSAR